MTFRLRKRKLGLLLSIVLLSSFTLAGCSSKDTTKDNEPTATTTSTPKETLQAKEVVEKDAVLKVWGGKSNFEKAAAEFEKKFGVKVEIEEVALKGPELQQYLLSKVTANQTADISALDADYSAFYDKGVFMPLNDLIERDGVKNWPWLQKDILKNLAYNGKIYFLPNGSAIYGLWYNINLAKQYGIYDMIPKSFDDPLYKTWTWDKYVEVLKKATVDTDGDGKIDIYGTDDNWGWGRTDWAASVGIFPSLVENGRIMVDNLNFNKPEAIEAIQFLNDLALVHKVAPPADLDTKAAGINIENEKVVIRRMGSWAFQYFKDKANPEREKAGKKPIEFSFTAYPHKAGMEDQYKVHGFSARGPMIFSKTKYPKAAWEFVKFFHSPEFESDNYDITVSGNLPKFSGTAVADKLKQQIGEQSAKIILQLGEHLIDEGKIPAQAVPLEYAAQYPAGQKPLDKLNAQIPDMRKGKVKFGDIIGPLYDQQLKDTKEAWDKFDKAAK